MIQRVDGLGLSLKPPKWLRQAASDLVAGKPTSVPVPGGGAVLVTPPTATTTAPPTFAQQASSAVSGIPGGWLTIAAGLAAVFLLPKMLKGRR